MTGRDGYELSDRWEEARLLMRLVRELWQKTASDDPGAARCRRLTPLLPAEALPSPGATQVQARNSVFSVPW